ncbi:Krr1-domain-containing protein [Hypoxylon cercidicola]|nr:Krr1-domain-containing protein [Hypoxylon cercidicola]
MAASDTVKRTLFEDSDDESDGGVKLQINAEYAKRFEYNKKREELARLEEKYKSKHANGDKSKEDNDESDSSSDEDEDDNGFLATEDLDAQISATLQAIKNKDPRVYDGKTTFYKPLDDSATMEEAAVKQKKEKPVFLQDYHREKILRGDTGADFDAEEEPPRTYAQEQDDLKQSIQDEIKAQLNAEDDAESSESDEDFLKAKEGTKSVAPENGIHPSRAGKIKVAKPDIAEADKDPELFLSNFMASRAWVGEEGSNWQAFESDEGEDDKADEWEAAFNLRFEDPNKSNEVLKSYARDVVAARSVRRDDKSARKRQREIERERKEEEKQKRKEERARLRRLKLDEAESRLKKIKQAAGLSGKKLKDEEWQKLLEDTWENDKWEEHLKKTFDDQYYAAEEEEVSEDEEGASAKKSKKIKKPKWDDDIDIKDLVPDFEDEERPNITLTDDEQGEEDEDEEEGSAAKRPKTTKERKREKLESQKAVRQERAKLEAFVDAKMDIDDPEILAGGPSSSRQGPARFAYRETRPESFGLTTRDILMATDADLNQFAGLKKLAHFRPDDKQSKDRKRLGKKARLRQWRKETFGPEFEREPPAFHPGGFAEDEQPLPLQKESSSNIIEGGSKKKRKRSRGTKKAAKEEAE